MDDRSCRRPADDKGTTAPVHGQVPQTHRARGDAPEGGPRQLHQLTAGEIEAVEFGRQSARTFEDHDQDIEIRPDMHGTR